MLTFVREREPEFVELLTKKNEHDLNRQFRECSRELEQATQRITKLDSIIQRLYEDNLDGKISDERFAKMTATYEQEQKDLSARVIVLRDTIAKAKTQRLNIDSFLAQVKKYTEVKELDAEIIRSLVERIDVFTPEKVPGTRTKKQTILIHWNFIGAVELPQEQKKSAYPDRSKPCRFFPKVYNPLVRHPLRASFCLFVFQVRLNWRSSSLRVSS